MRSWLVLGMVVGLGSACRGGSSSSEAPRDLARFGYGVHVEGNVQAGWGSTLPASAIVALLVRLAAKPERYRVHAQTVSTGSRYALDVSGAPPLDTIEEEGWARGFLLVYRANATLPTEPIDSGLFSEALLGGSTDKNLIYRSPGATSPNDPWLESFPSDGWACSAQFTSSWNGDLGSVRQLAMTDCTTIDLGIIAN